MEMWKMESDIFPNMIPSRSFFSPEEIPECFMCLSINFSYVYKSIFTDMLILFSF